MLDISVNKYIETWYFRLEKNGDPVEVIPFNWAFSTNKYYDSFIPAAQLNEFDLLFNNNRKSTVNYRFDFKEKLSEKDRHAINDRDTFFSLMRAYLPKFTIITEDDKEIEVDEFTTIYEDGFCSITHVYNLNGLEFDEALSTNLMYWGKIKYIKIDKNTYNLLKIGDEVLQFEDSDNFCIPAETILSRLNLNRKFAIGFDVIITILKEFYEKDEDNVADNIVFYHKGCIPVFRYYEFVSNAIIDKKLIDNIRNILQINPIDYIFNKNIDDTGLDLTQYEDSKTHGYGNMLIHVNGKGFKHGLELIVSYFMLFDYFLIEKAKNYLALVKFREIEKNEDVENLIEIRSNIIKSLKTDLLYDFNEDNFIKAKAVKKCLHIDIYIKELEKMHHRINDTIISVKEKQEKTFDKQREKTRQEINFQIQLFALILAIPTIFNIIDVFYAVDMPKLIHFLLVMQNYYGR